MPRPGSRVLLDLNNPAFQDVLFRLEAAELRHVIAAFARLRASDWGTIYRQAGLKWEAIDHIATPNGAKAHSIRLSQKIRAIAYRDGDFLRFLSLHPDHDSAYDR